MSPNFDAKELRHFFCFFQVFIEVGACISQARLGYGAAINNFQMSVALKQRFKSCSKCTVRLVTAPHPQAPVLHVMAQLCISISRHASMIAVARKRVLKSLQRQLNASAQRRHTSPVLTFYFQKKSHMVISKLKEARKCNYPVYPE